MKRPIGRVLNLWLSLCARVVPREERENWLAEWWAEFAHHDGDDRKRTTIGRALGALPDAWTLRLHGDGGFDMWMGDVRQAVRVTLRRPGFTVLAAATLALGLGATTALFTVVEGVLLRPFPYPDADRVVRLAGASNGEAQAGIGTVSYPNAVDIGTGAEALVAAATFDEWYPALTTAEGAAPNHGATVDTGFFKVLGVDPFAGRFFRADEQGADRERVVVVTHSFWRDHLGADPDAVGRDLILNDQPYRLVGVVPPDFEDPGLQGLRWGAPQVWRTPWFEPSDRSRSGRSFTAIARLAPGVALSAAQAEVDALFSALAEEWPEENAGRGMRVVPLSESVVGQARPGLLALVGAVGLVLLIACANVANLLLAQGGGRHDEMAVRRALGASRRRLLAQLALESLVLALIGGVLGVGLALLAVDTVARVTWLPRATGLTLDVRALCFASIAALGSAMLCGLLPAFRTTSGTRVSGTRGATGSRLDGRLRRALVVGELALCTTLLVGAGLLLRSLTKLYGTDLGVDVSRVLAADVHPSAFGAVEVEELDTWMEGLLAEVAALPGVEAVGGIDITPLSGSYSCDGIERPERPHPGPGQGPCAEVRMVAGEALRALGVTLRSGRFPDASDRRDGPTVVAVNRTTAELMWPEGNALGSTLSVHGAEARVVGVVDDIREAGPQQIAPPMVFLPAAQDPWLSVTGRGLTVLVRSRERDPLGLAAGVRESIRIARPDAPVADVRPLRALLDRTVAEPRVRALVFGSFAGLALGLAVIGVGGVMAHGVARRRKEIGVRLAIGADRREVARMVVAEGLRLTAVGVGVGLVGGVLLASTLDAFLFGISRWDPPVLLGVPVLLALAALVACALPASRAARLEPTRALTEN